MNARARSHRIALIMALLAACLAFGSTNTSAHHSFAAEFDIRKPVELRGTVRKLELINPHSWIHLEVVDKDGKKEIWMIEGGSPNQLFRKGFTKNSIPVGTEIVAVGYQARDGTKKAVGRTLKLGNGKELFFESSAPAAPAAPH